MSHVLEQGAERMMGGRLVSIGGCRPHLSSAAGVCRGLVDGHQACASAQMGSRQSQRDSIEHYSLTI